MLSIEEILRERDIPFDYRDNRIMCFPHIINICNTHIIASFTDPALADNDAEFIVSLPPQDRDHQTYEEALARDPIALCRSTVCAIRASGKRRDHFNEIICDGNAKGWFRDPKDPEQVIQLKQCELLRDVRTRWDSLYQMIR